MPSCKCIDICMRGQCIMMCCSTFDTHHVGIVAIILHCDIVNTLFSAVKLSIHPVISLVINCV